jgi:hypothetical protein
MEGLNLIEKFPSPYLKVSGITVAEFFGDWDIQETCLISFIPDSSSFLNLKFFFIFCGSLPTE